MAPVFFSNPAEFRAWLAKNHHSRKELLVGFYKKASGKPSITWPESVDEALCFGWIDGVRKSIDELSYSIRFTPRKPGSIWSAVNIAKVAALIAGSRMQPAGIEAFEARKDHKSRVYAFEQGQVVLPGNYEKTFKKQKVAWSFFECQPPSYRKTMIWWVISAKQEATRESRLARLVAACGQGLRLR